MTTGKGLPTMDWPTRLKIALGSAKGLAYLHEDCKKFSHSHSLHHSLSLIFMCLIAGHPRIIHRDIKGSNILLDFNFEAQVIAVFMNFLFIYTVHLYTHTFACLYAKQ